MVEPASIASAIAALAAWAFAGVILASFPRAQLHRALAALLVVEGALQAASLLPEEGVSLGALVREIVFLATLPAVPWLHLLGVSYLVGAKAPRLATPRARRALVGLAAGLPLVMLGGALFQRPSEGTVWAIPLFITIMLSLIVVSLASVVLLVRAWRLAPRGTLERERAAMAAAAFAGRDALVVAAATLAALVAGGVLDEAWLGLVGPGFALSVLVFAGLLAYGALRTRVLDLRSRVRVGVARSTLAAVFVAGYVAASQTAALLLAPSAGILAGVAAVLLLAVLFVPLQRLASRFAGAALPPEPAPLQARRIEAYRLAVEELGEANDPLLQQLRARWGLTERDHEILVHVTRAAATLPDAIAPGQTILGRFVIEAELGAGGEGRTFRARDAELDRTVALKIIHADAGRSAEARALARLRHPRVVAIHDVRMAGERAVLVLEHVEGESLASRLRRGALDPAELAAFARDVAEALVALHDAGLAHGDVKPSNVLLEPNGRAKLADLGIAALVGEETTQLGFARPAPRATPRYAAPEQLAGRKPSPAADQYGFARTIEEAAGELPPALAAWVARALSPDPAARFASTRAMVAALDEALRASYRS